MLKDEYTIVFEHVFFEDHVGNVCQLFEGIRWVGEDKVELLSTALHKAEHIPADSDTLICIQLLQALLDKRMVVTVGLHTDYLTAAP